MIEQAGLDADLLETPACGSGREPCAVLDPVESLLLGRSDELAVDHERGCGVSVVGVEAEDRCHVAMLGVASSSETGKRRASSEEQPKLGPHASTHPIPSHRTPTRGGAGEPACVSLSSVIDAGLHGFRPSFAIMSRRRLPEASLNWDRG